MDDDRKLVFGDLAHFAAQPNKASKEAMRLKGVSSTYEGLYTDVRRAGNWFVQRLAPQSRVALVLENSAELVVAFLGATMAGMVAVPIDRNLSEKNLKYLLDDSAPSAIVANHREIPRIEACYSRTSDRPILVACSASGEKRPSGIDGFDSLLDEPLLDKALVTDPNTPASIMYTTGTTGLRKGVVLSHRALSSAVHNINEFTQLPMEPTEVVAMPMTHSFALARLRCVFAKGGTAIVLPGITLQPRAFLDAINSGDVTSMGLVPAACRMLVDQMARHVQNTSQSIKVIELGSDFLAREYKTKLMELFPSTRICMHYGLTEASRSSFVQFSNDPRSLDTIGQPSPNVEIHVCKEDGTETSEGEAGEVWIRGSILASRYWRKPEDTARAFVDGWFRSGDSAIQLSDGYIELRGRKNDVFKIGGLSVSPYEVESVLNEHTSVRESAVCLCKSDKGPAGVEIVAHVVVGGDTPPETELLRAFCRQNLESYKVPASFKFVSELPRTASGKLQRKKLEET